MPTKELGKSGEDAPGMPVTSGHQQCSSPLPDVSRIGCGAHTDKLNFSPRSSHHSYCLETDLIKEIAALELEVLHLEQYLLSLYRAAFDQHLTTSLVKEPACESPSTCQEGSPLKYSGNPEKYESKLVNPHQQSAPIDSCNNRMDKLGVLENIKKKNELKFQHFAKHPRNELADSEDRNAPSTVKRSGDSRRPTSHSCSLADHLGSSLIHCVSEAPGKLSEEIIRCISSIYNKLAEQPVPQIDFSASPISSISSSSTFSPRYTNDAWSPKYHYESIISPSHSQVPKGRQGPYSRMLEVHKICMDGDRFNYAEKMLQKFRFFFRALIGQLEAVDPIKMGNEDKLAFWINIHNALVMHAFLAYGLHQNHIKCTSSIMKAAYNVGGLSINAQEIQSSILCCQLHRPEVGLQKLFLQSQKLMKRKGRHPYAAVKHREPLVHFALCMGAYSDPAVRIYTAKNLLEELKLAKYEFVQSNVMIRKETKIFLPKILQYYARDAAMDISAILEMVHDCMPEAQQKAVRMCLKGRQGRCVEWSSYKSDFRYIISEEYLAEE